MSAPRRRIVLFGHSAADQADRLRALLPRAVEVLPVPEDASQPRIDAALQGCTVLVSRSFDERHRAARGLRLLQVTGAGLDRVRGDLLPAGCTLCNVHGHEIGMAEYVLAAMLEHTVGLSRLDRGFRCGSWQGGAHGSGGLRGELFGATVGIVGYGAVGRAVATRAAAFGMRVGAISARARPGAPLDWCVAPGEIDRCLGQLDHLVLCCPLTPRTRGLVDRSRLALLKPGAVLINVGRAGLVDETALLAALDAGTVARAVLDVWWRYPAADDPAPAPSQSGLHRHPGVIATPHASGWTGAMLRRKWRRIADNLIAHLDGRTPAGIVPHPSHG